MLRCLNDVGLAGVLDAGFAVSTDADRMCRRRVWLDVSSWSWADSSVCALDAKIDLSERGSLPLSKSMVLYIYIKKTFAIY